MRTDQTKESFLKVEFRERTCKEEINIADIKI